MKLLNDEQEEFLKSVVKGNTCAQITKIINRKYNLNLSTQQIKSLKNRLKLKSGVDARFKKGMVPYNKGKKNVTGMSSTRFKKGRVPYNFRPVGSLRYPEDNKNYVMIKVANPNKWQQYHDYLWEKHKGKIPKGYVVVFADGNNRNFDINNLDIMSRTELMEMNRLRIKSCKEKVLIAKIMTKSRNKERMMKNEQSERIDGHTV